jgi:hypothetical protein
MSCLATLPRIVLKPGSGHFRIYLFPTVQRRESTPEFLVKLLQLLSTDPVVLLQ